MDRAGADFLMVVEQVKKMLGSNAVPLQLPIGAEETFKGVVDLINFRGLVWNEHDRGMTYEVVDIPADMVEEATMWREKLLEAVSEYDDNLMEKFFEDPASITEREILDALRAACLDMKIVPMLCGSSFKDKGVQTMLDLVMELMPSPLDRPNIVGTHPDTGEEVIRRPNYQDPFAGLAFKIATDPYVGRLAFTRAYSGVLEAGSYVLNTRSGNKERISRIFQMHANKQNPIEKLGAGDIGAVVGFKDIRTGDTLCAENAPIVLESMNFPDPVIGLAIEPKTQKDADKLGMALSKLAEEDPTFKVKFDEDTSQTVISGMGELHLEIILDRLTREFKVECNQGAPQVNYKEAITETITHREKYAKQSGGRGKFADIQVEIGPGSEGAVGLEFINDIFGGSIPKEYIPSVEKGFKEAMKTGVLAGFEMPNLKVRLFDGSFHQVDSDSLSFELAAKMAFREACRKAKPILMEPIMKLEVITPEENTGDVVGDLNRRRGMLEGMEMKNNANVIKAKVPLSEMFGYVTDLRTITSGRATSIMELSHYQSAPANITEMVITKVKGKVKAE
jgi:elongation factor G